MAQICIKNCNLFSSTFCSAKILLKHLSNDKVTLECNIGDLKKVKKISK